MKNLKKICSILLALSVIIAPAVVPSAASACSCMAQPDINDEALEAAGAVFAGTFIGADTSPENSNVLRFQVSETWKGPNDQAIGLSTPKDSAACGWNPEVGQEYLVYAYETNSDSRISGDDATQYAINLCSRMIPIADAGSDLESLGEGRIPDVPSESGASASSGSAASAPLAYKVVGGVIVIALAYGILRNFRK